MKTTFQQCNICGRQFVLFNRLKHFFQNVSGTNIFSIKSLQLLKLFSSSDIVKIFVSHEVQLVDKHGGITREIDVPCTYIVSKGFLVIIYRFQNNIVINY